MFVSAFELFRIGLGPVVGAYDRTDARRAPLRPRARSRRRVLPDAPNLRWICTVRSRAWAAITAPIGRSLPGSAGDAPDAVDPQTLAARADARRAARASSRSTAPRASPSIRRPTSSSTSTRRSPITATRCALPRATRAARPSPRVCISRPATARSSPTATCRARARRCASRMRSRPRRSSSRCGQGHGKKLADMARTNELALRSPGEVRAGLLQFAATMRNAVERGLATGRSRCPGGHGRPRRAATQAAAIAGTDPALAGVGRRLRDRRRRGERAGGRVVAAPSNGSAGPVAAVLHQWRSAQPLAGDDGSVTFLLAAAAVGQLLARRRREARRLPRRGRCRRARWRPRDWRRSTMRQQSPGPATRRSARSSPSSACRATRRAASCRIRASPATLPRPRTRSALRAWRCGCPIRLSRLDSAIRTMNETGREMASRYKESSLGGLAVNVVEC